MNCARIYNCSLASPHAYINNNKLAYRSTYTFQRHEQPTWSWALTLRDEDVANGFYIYSLLLDKAECGSCLVLDHDVANQRLRLGPALAERNKRMEGIGQESYNHACDLCYFVYRGDDDKLCVYLL